jgi:apolipoprotein N-acyltransferase
MLFLGSISSIYAFGYHRIQSYEPQYYENVFVRLVQPNIAQKMRWSHEQREENFNKVLKASQLNKKDLSKITHFIWSETAVPFLLYADKEKFSQINKQLLQNTKTLITGQIRFDEQGYLRNSVMAFTSEGQVIDYYDKTHLVPFGEYLPYDDVLSKIGFRKIVPFGKGFAEGEKRKSIQMGHFPTFLPLICYEIIFSNVTEKQKNIDFDVIVNVTNDAWFGNSIGPYQHLTHAKLRALENGVTVLRVANTGISAVINPLGIIKKSTKIDKTAIIDTKIEKKYQN